MIKESDLEIFKGIINVAKIDEKVYQHVIPLIEYFQKQEMSKQKIYQSLFIDEFNPNIAKEIFSSENKDFFFSCIVLTACLDELSEREEKTINNYAEILDFSKDKLQQIFDNVKTELEREKEKDSMQWLRRTVKAYLKYFESGFTPFEGFYSMRLLHFLTNNRSSEIIGFMAKIFNPEYENAEVKENNLSLKNKDELEIISENIKENSYHIFENKIDSELCNRIIAYARKTPAYPSLANQEHFDHITGKRLIEKIMYSPDNPVARRYDFDVFDIIQNPDIQKIAFDEIFLKVAQEYFQAKPVLNMVTMWWSSDYQGPPSRYTGQVYHIDIDRAKFLNFFIYLTDVNSENGSHIYIKGSHNFKPLELLIDKRMTDEELADVYKSDDFIEITGKQGTVFVGDTKAFHKGNPLKKGERLVLQLDFSTDRFGENCPRVEIEDNNSKFKEIKEKYPYTYMNFI